MPTGPFAALGMWPVLEHDGSTPRTGAAPRVRIVKATRKYIKYTRKCQRHDPKGERVRHGKIFMRNAQTYAVSVGSFQHVQAKR